MFLLAKNWWSLLLRGTLSILFGVLTLMWPGLTLGALVTGFGVYAFIDGVVNIVGVVRHSRQHQRWASLLIEGIAGILAGVVTIAWPAITLAVLVTLVAVWAIVTGVLEIVAAIRLRKHMHGEWLLALGGIASIAFGVLVLAAPLAGALVLATWFGAYAIIWGVILITASFRVRSWAAHGGGPVRAATGSAAG